MPGAPLEDFISDHRHDPPHEESGAEGDNIHAQRVTRARLGALIAIACFMALPRSALARDPVFGANDLETLFFISKSDDHNRVDYGMRLDTHCAPYGDEPVFPYWREFEPPPPVRTKSMGAFSRMGYGISTERVLKRTPAGGEMTIKLKQVDRTIFITTSRDADGRCSALVRTKIAGVDHAQLVSIFVKLTGPLSVAYIDIKGYDLAKAKTIVERVRH